MKSDIKQEIFSVVNDSNLSNYEKLEKIKELLGGEGGGPKGPTGKINDYVIGYAIGREYAKEMFKHGGLKPIIGNLYEIHNNLHSR